MTDSSTSLVKREDAPAWVRLGLWQIDSRRSAQMFLVLSGVLGAVGVAAGFALNPMYYVAAAFWLAAPWYAAAIRWMDAHRAWPDD